MLPPRLTKRTSGRPACHCFRIAETEEHSLSIDYCYAPHEFEVADSRLKRFPDRLQQLEHAMDLCGFQSESIRQQHSCKTDLAIRLVRKGIDKSLVELDGLGQLLFIQVRRCSCSPRCRS